MDVADAKGGWVGVAADIKLKLKAKRQQPGIERRKSSAERFRGGLH